ncbi:transposase [Clostridium sp. UBA2485]|uniref:transposase n=1 Tax=Clostridium sp. UBA2485 TaxID=1946352 RepID=UPI0039C8982F
MVIYYRREVINDVSIRLKDIFDNISKNYNITTVEWEYYRNHVQILFKAHSNSELSKFINAYNSRERDHRYS